ncbi:MAG: hypothetical protein HC806_06075 [Anaerolineae bacterium]|nr:hypothetical protein [Anaerolineae bacterium]
MRLAESVVLQASNAIYNAQLFEQTQQAFSETTTLYQAGSELNAVQNYDEILAVLQKYTILGHENCRNVSINLFDQPWTSALKPETLIPLTQWNRISPKISTRTRTSLSEWPNVEDILKMNDITFVENLPTDPRMKIDAARMVYEEIMHAKCIILPRWSLRENGLGISLQFMTNRSPFPNRIPAASPP